MKKPVLVACEESQAVTVKLRNMGIEAFSNDIVDCSGPLPQYHIRADLNDIINEEWGMIIAFPPCTDLCVSGSTWFEEKRKDGRQQRAFEFFMNIVNANCKHIAIENPVGVMSTLYRKPDQIIHPYYFGDPVSKKTCLWLKNLPLLYYQKTPDLFSDKTTVVDYEYRIFGNGKKYSGPAANWYSTPEERSKQRSKTYPGIANAMGQTWGNYYLNQ
jgi:site-specific DNA-cytosine methylase